jgi:hypothetical protein
LSENRLKYGILGRFWAKYGQKEAFLSEKG